ncbi:glycosyl hydrolase [Pseudomonas agarici]|uniref:Glycosyl hydrolase n=1 Tax=Pseudomonas agarici TaxID=46677 RepID=A0A0X1SWZ2_PSEAA|nr:family 10 glycosylhydrolase [Pseudomonas agarici]AMB84396.1 glycosyl hydrolase [Pseudomonas agarici]
MNTDIIHADKHHLRASWMATVANLDWPSRASSTIGDEAERVRVQKSELIEQLDELVKLNMNAVFFQVKPCSDAFFRSAILPWSAWLTGTLGQDPGFDPLAFVIEQAHARNLELHAWFNPYRVSMDTRQSTVDSLRNTLPGAPSSVYVAHPEWVAVAYDRFVLDPGIPEAVDWVIQGVLEVALNYDVDGIHFDDYFYYESASSRLDDAATFSRYGQAFDNKGDWRRDNTYRLISQLSRKLRELKPALKFGVSPAGVWRNRKDDPRGSDTSAGIPNYDAGYADTRLWVTEELIDYIAPQVYWTFGLKAAQFDIVTRWWADTVRGKNVHLYIGQALYKVGVPSQREPEWSEGEGGAELDRQLRWNLDIPEIRGSILFRQRFLRAPQTQAAIAAIRADIWRYPALIPSMLWKAGQPPAAPSCVQQQQHNWGTQVKWHESSANAVDKTRYYAIYRFPSGVAVDIARADCLVATLRRAGCLHIWNSPPQSEPACVYAVTALDENHRESRMTLSD